MNLKYLLNNLVSKFISKHGISPVAFVVHTPAGKAIPIGENPIFEVYLRNQAGLKAFKSLNKLKLAEAYLNADIDVEGDFIKAISFESSLFSDRNIWLKTWRHLKPRLVGREKCNPDWIAKHYDSNNIQLFATDFDYNTYTPGIYKNDEDSLEVGAERKLAFAFQSLKLKPNYSVLDIGSGWGGFLRYAARRNVQVTGITLSHHQKQYVENLIKENNFNAQVIYQDFFSFQPPQKYDGISMMGVIEDLSDYPKVIKTISNWIKPGGRIYLDFAAKNNSLDTVSFITKYVWPGAFRLVVMPEFVDAVRNSPFEIVGIHNDRRNYYLWSKGVKERWEHKKAEIVKHSNEKLWRTFELLFAGTASFMENPNYHATAYRVVLEFPADFMRD